MKKMWDISQSLRKALPVWPGEPDFDLQRLANISADCPVNVSKLTFSTHAGTHADSPLHYDNDGVDSAGSNLDPYIGVCRVIDVRTSRGCLRLEDFDHEALVDVERILFRTYETFPVDKWDADFVSIDVGVIEFLAARKVKLIGTDTASLDPQNSKEIAAHQIVRRNDMRILEGLVLDAVEPGLYELIALPLKIDNADASPLRAILREL